MTVPHERMMALKNINLFLMDMAYIRKRADRVKMAQRLLRHYPGNSELESVRELLLKSWYGWIK